MKKILSIILIAMVVVLFASCGPSYYERPTYETRYYERHNYHSSHYYHPRHYNRRRGGGVDVRIHN